MRRIDDLHRLEAGIIDVVMVIQTLRATANHRSDVNWEAEEAYRRGREFSGLAAASRRR